MQKGNLSVDSFNSSDSASGCSCSKRMEDASKIRVDDTMTYIKGFFIRHIIRQRLFEYNMIPTD
jgi:hypothetical protein